MAGPALAHDTRTETTVPVQEHEVILHHEENWDEPAPSDRRCKTDEQLLQGAWLSFDCQPQVEFLVAGTHFTVRFSDGPIYMGTFRLNSHIMPRAMDLYIEEGPVPHRNKPVLCIYELDGDLLRVAANKPGETERLTYFPIENNSTYLRPTFRREKC